MNAQCPGCRQPLPSEVPNLRFCPACGYDLVKGAPGAGWIAEGVDLRAVAHRQRMLLWCVLAAILLQIMPLVGGSLPAVAIDMLMILALGVVVTIVVGVVRMLAALRTHIVQRILFAVLMFAPCVNLLMLLIANQMAYSALQRAGLHVGFMGVKDEDVVRILGLNRCRNCGYSLIGNVSGRCPECGTPTGSAPTSGPT